jgi:hypothetical protein
MKQLFYSRIIFAHKTQRISDAKQRCWTIFRNKSFLYIKIIPVGHCLIYLLLFLYMLKFCLYNWVCKYELNVRTELVHSLKEHTLHIPTLVRHKKLLIVPLSWLLQLRIDVSFEAYYLSVVDIRKYTHNLYNHNL